IDFGKNQSYRRERSGRILFTYFVGQQWLYLYKDVDVGKGVGAGPKVIRNPVLELGKRVFFDERGRRAGCGG
ncbi:MAG: hypothetical protein OXH09_16895, partial [Gammaproteobacteria bacterium]|nr:hypothetical protein [Gammaproteobacteria bacterium]